MLKESYKTRNFSLQIKHYLPEKSGSYPDNKLKKPARSLQYEFMSETKQKGAIMTILTKERNVRTEAKNQPERRIMAKCEFIDRCPFFNKMISTGGTLDRMYKEQFCNGSYKMCARYKIASTLGKEKVPVNLYPNMFDQAEALIRPKN